MALRLIRALPGERRCLSPLPCQHRPAGIDATVAAPGPHDFAVRCERFVRLAEASLTPQASIATRATFRDDREAPLMAARAGHLLLQIGIPVKRNIWRFRSGQPKSS